MEALSCGVGIAEYGNTQAGANNSCLVRHHKKLRRCCVLGTMALACLTPLVCQEMHRLPTKRKVKGSKLPIGCRWKERPALSVCASEMR